MRQKRALAVAIILLGIVLACHPPKKTTGVENRIPSALDPLYKDVQRTTFAYFWEGAEPNSGMARERIHLDNVYPQQDQNIVTTGGTGFGVMAILVGIERGFITRKQGYERLSQIVNFLAKADRFHGAWPHWINGETGRVKPFGKKDNGGDLVETSFLIQGLLTVRQYFQSGNKNERALADSIDRLWNEVDFNWYRNGRNVLYWHWSPDYAWQMNFPVHGYNECLVMYVLAASSPVHGTPPQVYHEGWARNGRIDTAITKYGYTLPLIHNGATDYGGPLFWAHYSYLGLDPRGLKDRYADYWENNLNQVRINRAWCIDNPKKYKGYGGESWGLTAGYSVNGYEAHMPGLETDRGVITPTAALSSMPYTPDYSIQAMKHWHDILGDKVYGPYGFFDGFSETYDWYPRRYLAIDQGPIVVMMENYRTGLLWNLFMSCPEVKMGLKKLGFQSPHLQAQPE